MCQLGVQAHQSTGALDDVRTVRVRCDTGYFLVPDCSSAVAVVFMFVVPLLFEVSDRRHTYDYGHDA